jgi:hypothetical protein
MVTGLEISHVDAYLFMMLVPFVSIMSLLVMIMSKFEECDIDFSPGIMYCAAVAYFIFGLNLLASAEVTVFGTYHLNQLVGILFAYPPHMIMIELAPVIWCGWLIRIVYEKEAELGKTEN